jgi:hypothetical protein
MKIFVVARDSLGAESLRAEQEIVVKRPFAVDIQSFEEAFNVRDLLTSVVTGGGNGESVLRAIQSIASVCNEAGAANFSSALSQWNRQARELMLEESVKLRTVLRGSNLLSPRLLAMEASALKNLLAVPVEVSLKSQQTGLNLVMEILESTRSQLNTLSVGESAEELLPPDLIQSSLQSISSLAEAAIAVLLRTSAEDADLNGEDGDYNQTERSLGAVQSGSFRQQFYLAEDQDDEWEVEYRSLVGTSPTSAPTKKPKIAPEPRDRSSRQSEACQVLTNLRNSIGDLASVKLFGAASGRVQDVLSVGGIRITVAREDTSSIGQPGEGVESLSLRVNETDSETNKRPTAFRLPPNLLSNQTLDGREPPTQVDIVAIQWAFDVRCDNDTNVFADAYETELPDSQKECALLDIDPEAPISSISGVSSLEFFDSDDVTDRLSPSGLDDTILIEVPVSEEVLLNDAQYCGGGNSTTIKCGYYDEEFGGGWTTNGCNVSEINYEELYVVCECNHASDYAAWQAFVEDADSTITAPFTNPIQTVTTLAILLLVVIIPCLVAVYAIMMFWAKRKDASQVDKVPRGALVLMVLNHTMMQSKQRRFFSLMKAKMLADTQERATENAAKVDPESQGAGSVVIAVETGEETKTDDVKKQGKIVCLFVCLFVSMHLCCYVEDEK